MQTTMPATFWKSPYSGDAGVWKNPSRSTLPRNPYVKSELDVIRSKLKTTSLPPADIKPVAVRSILKHSDNMSGDTADGLDTARSGYSDQGLKPTSGKLRLITTGTGKGEPYGSKPRAKTATKRVKFGGLPSTQTLLPGKLRSLPPASANVSLTRYGNRSHNPRILGSFMYSSAGIRAAVHGHSGSNMSLGNTVREETQIKYQINDIVKRLRQSENCRVSNVLHDEEKPVDKRRQTGTTDKLPAMNGRLKSAGKTFFDWAEYDIELSEVKNKQSKTDDDNEPEAPIVHDSRQDEESDSFSSSDSLESFPTDSEKDVIEETRSGAQIIRPRPNASLYTKYRHITRNTMNKYDLKASSSSAQYHRLQSNRQTGGSVSNFCDKNKASQIMDWLVDVNNAQTDSSDHVK